MQHANFSFSHFFPIILGVISFLLSNIFLRFISLSFSFLVLIIVAAIIEETFKIMFSEMFQTNLKLIAFAFGISESIYYLGIFGVQVIFPRVIATLAHIFFAIIYHKFERKKFGYLFAVIAHFLWDCFWLL